MKKIHGDLLILICKKNPFRHPVVPDVPNVTMRPTSLGDTHKKPSGSDAISSGVVNGRRVDIRHITDIRGINFCQMLPIKAAVLFYISKGFT
jgi:hypothetical protein